MQVALYPVSLCIATLSARFRAYPELFALTGGTVPDLRGLFLRGYGSQQYNSGGYGVVFHASVALGQIQGDAIRNITGEIKGGTVEDYSSTSGVFELTTLLSG